MTRSVQTKCMLLLIMFCSFFILANSEDTVESRKEPIHKKLLTSNLKAHDPKKSESSTSKIVFESSVTPTIAAVASKLTENKKIINKRQQYTQAKPVRQLPNRGTDPPKKRVDSCPLCDSSVFSYCSDKLLHDACCCLNPFENELPYQCQYADCNFLHANSCREHHLITSCCCDRYLL